MKRGILFFLCHLIVLFSILFLPQTGRASETIRFFDVDTIDREFVAEITFPNRVRKGSTIEWREPLDAEGLEMSDETLSLKVKFTDRDGCVFHFETEKIDEHYLSIDDYRKCGDSNEESFWILAVVLSKSSPGFSEIVLGGLPVDE